jgi:hypothetical protein
MRRISAFLAVALLSLAFTGSAFAQSATENAYSGIAGVQQFGGGGGGGGAGGEEAVVSGTSSSGSLPFTGLDVGLIVLAGVALVGTGLVIRRVSQPSLKA